MRNWCGAALVILVTAMMTTSARGYMVGPPIPLEELARRADVVFKGTVIADVPANDSWFEPVMGFEVREAQLRVVSVIKGSPGAGLVRFHHYAPTAGAGQGSYEPQSYSLTLGRSYLLLGALGPGGELRQVLKRHTMQEDQGMFLAADDRPHRGATLTAAAWAELQGLLGSPSVSDATYAITELDALSGGRATSGIGDPLKDFDRAAALGAIRPMVLSREEPVASAAIGVFGADSPFLDDEDAPYWLAGMGKGTIAGLAGRTPSANPAAGVAVKELTLVADGTASSALRARAIRALGRTGAASPSKLAAWSSDPDPAIRSAAVRVSSSKIDRAVIARTAKDASADVRRSTALAIGFSQDASLAPTLRVLLQDPEPRVRAAAAVSLLAFGPDQAEAALKEVPGSDFRPLFVDAVARRDPQPYLPMLGEIIEKNLEPNRWWGGTIPAGESWSILFDYVKSRPAGELTGGHLGGSLDSLERMRWFTSSEPRDLYALYVKRGMSVRAKSFRDAMRKSPLYDDTLFDMAAKDPATYIP